MIFDNLSRNFLFPSFCFAAENEGGSGTATEETEETEKEEEPESSESQEGEDEIVTIKGKQYKASELLGADGIPRSKNLSVELERKNREIQEQKDLLKGIVQQQPAQQQPNPQQQFDSIVQAVKSKYPNVDEDTARMAVEISQGMVQAQAIARAPIDAEYFVDRAKSSIKDPEDRSTLDKWGDEVNEALSGMPTNWKSTPQVAAQAVRNAIDVVKGRHVKDILADAKAGLDSRGGIRPRDTSVVSSGGAKVPKGAGNHGAGLTDAQKKEQQSMGNISESDYRVTLKKAQERDKAAGRPLRQTLN